MPDTLIPCPGCGKAETRTLTRQELKDRHGGKDPLVVVRPRLCEGCGRVWEPPPSRPVCWIVAALAAAGWLLGVAIVLGAIGLLVAAVFAEPGGANNPGNRGKLSALGLLGIPLATGGFQMMRRYIALAKRPDDHQRLPDIQDSLDSRAKS